jgi:S-adenosylmethionine hydrolase
LTDFGTQDPYVAMMKGVLLGSAREATVVDLTHGVPAQDVRAAAWIWKHSLSYFPPGTIHVAVVDPGVGSRRRLLAVFDRDQVLLAPDNGLVSPSLSPAAEVFELDEERFARRGSSRTFHGRDILAPAAAHLARGGSSAECVRARLDAWVELDLARPVQRESGEVAGEIVFCDRFGNLISNLTPRDLEREPAGDLAAWRLWAGTQSIPIRGTYAEAASGELLALVDSYGALEIAVRDGSAADVLRLGPGAAISARRFR